jgi:LysM repeat protein
MKRIIYLIVLLPLLSFAQQKPLMIAGTAPAFYINHTVAPKENYYSIGRLYNISPKEIAPFNNLELEKGLSLNQSIKIPLTNVNFVQQSAAEADEALVPVYHSVKEKEGLYRIGANYNMLPVATLKAWNNIKTDAVANGTKLIVGFLRVKKDLSAFSGMAKPLATTANNTQVVNNPAEQPKTTEQTKTITEPAASVKEKPAEPVKEKQMETVKEKPVTVPSEKPEPIKQVTAPTETKEWTGRNFNKAVFKPDFDKQIRQSNTHNETGAGIAFKSTSGWEDGRYYCLHNAALPGTILKITSTSTGKSIYAKVLDAMPNIKQNTDLLLCLSNAATEELGVGENKFDCAVQYAK